jgi:DNA-binding winged helix-turn-helix (wHTH) protein/predicted ATPase
MKTTPLFFFPPFRLDVGDEQLWRGAQAIELRPKTFAVLRYLVEHLGRLVTKEEVLNAVWPQTVVSEWVLKSCVRELREALGDEARTPQYIETVHRRGYRFIAAVVSSQHSVVSSQTLVTGNGQLITPLVGRETELAQLHGWLEKALGGARQIVFVTGEPGIGKTALVEAFLQSLDASVWIGRGQCIEHYGAGEAYLPVLEALERLCQEPGSERLVKLLDQYAPTWLAQMPWLLNAGDLEALQRKVLGATPERMLREMAKVLEALTAERPLVLVLEDLHWSDYSTLDLISFLAPRRERARLLLIGTYRPAEMLMSGHPLQSVKQELQIHGYCKELALTLLSEAVIAEYLEQQFASEREAWHTVPLRSLAHVIHQRTDGNPLFMVNVVGYLIAQGVMFTDESLEEVRARIPESLRQMIEKQVLRLSPEEQRVLEAASVAGMEFSAAAVATGIEAPTAEVEKRCEEMARREQFLREKEIEEWPDGTVSARYSFLHALYPEVVYTRVAAGRRISLHRRIGEREEAAYGNQAAEIATELAVHFECSRDYGRAVRYLEQAAEKAIRRSAYQEAIGHLTKGLRLLETLPDTPERAQRELTLQIALGSALMATKGQGVVEIGTVYARARELCQQVGEPSQLFTVLRGLRFFHVGRGEFQTVYELAEQLLTLARSVQDRDLLLEAHRGLGASLYWQGEFALAREQLEQGIALYDPQQHSSHAFLYGQETGIFCWVYSAFVLWVLGYPDQALQRGREALTLAQQVSYPLSLAFALHHAAWLHQFRREEQLTQERAEATLALSIDQGFALYVGMGTLVLGWALAEQGQREEGIAQMRQGLAAWQGIGIELLRPYYLALLAEAYSKAGQVEEALTLLAEAQAVVHRTRERWWEAELYRLKGELTLAQSSVQGLGSRVQKSRKSKGKSQKEASAPSRLRIGVVIDI